MAEYAEFVANNLYIIEYGGLMLVPFLTDMTVTTVTVLETYADYFSHCIPHTPVGYPVRLPR